MVETKFISYDDPKEVSQPLIRKGLPELILRNYGIRLINLDVESANIELFEDSFRNSFTKGENSLSLLLAIATGRFGKKKKSRKGIKNNRLKKYRRFFCSSLQEPVY